MCMGGRGSLYYTDGPVAFGFRCGLATLGVGDGCTVGRGPLHTAGPVALF